jgi:hypothetical protein
MNFFPEKTTIDEKIDSYICNAFFTTRLEQIPLDAIMKIVMLEAKKDNFIIKYTKTNGQSKIRNIHYYIKKCYGSLSNYLVKTSSQFKVVREDCYSFISIVK